MIAARKPPTIQRIFIVEGERCRKVPLTRGLYALVNKKDYKRVMKHGAWSATANKKGQTFYATAHIITKPKVDKSLSMHRFIMGFVHNDGRLVDHRNGRGWDNRRSNLRECTSAQNGMNRRITPRNRYGFRGITPIGKKWGASINIYLGSFRTKIEAAMAFDIAAKKYHGEFASLNFPN